jgi:hypothetical protein
MKKNIKEQTSQNQTIIDPARKNIVNAPKDELNILETNGFLRGKGVLSNLALYPDGTPKAVKVGNKKYYAAKKYDRGNGKPVVYFTYDGRILFKVSDGVYKFAQKPNGQPALVQGIPDTGLKSQFTNVLTQFGINPDDPQTDVYFYLNEVTKQLQEYINKGAVSNLFRIWNDMLTYYFPNDYRTNKLHQLQLKMGEETFTPTIDKSELDTKYDKLTDVQRFGNLSFQGGEFPIYMPKGATPDTTFNKTKVIAKDCKTQLLQYLGTAMDWQMNGGSINPTIQQYKPYIVRCKNAGAYDEASGFTNITQTELSDYVDFSAKNSPFGFFRQGKTLSWNNIKNILAGKSNVLKRPNPYIIGQQIAESKKDELKSLIKENLITLSEEKKTKLLGESKIINIRLGIIKESNTGNKDKLFNDIISEMVYLNNQGFDKELINEGFWEILGGLFPSTNTIGETFKEYLTKWLIEAIAPGQENGWIGNIIITSVGNLKIGDITKLTNCEFTTKLLSKSISEAVVRKFAESKGISGVLADLIRNSMIEQLDSTEFAQKLESGLAHVICPLLGGVSQKMSTVANKMKDKAIAG